MSTPFKMKGFSGFGNSPMKQKSDTTKTYPEGYTEEDIKFLEEQREDVVRYEDLDKKGQEIWKSQGQPVPKKKKSGPLKQGSQHEKMYEVEEQMSYIEEDLEDSDEYLASQGKNRKELKNKLAKLTNKRDSIHSTLKGGNIKPGYDPETGDRDKSRDVKYPK